MPDSLILHDFIYSTAVLYDEQYCMISTMLSLVCLLSLLDKKNQWNHHESPMLIN